MVAKYVPEFFLFCFGVCVLCDWLDNGQKKYVGSLRDPFCARERPPYEDACMHAGEERRRRQLARSTSMWMDGWMDG